MEQNVDGAGHGPGYLGILHENIPSNLRLVVDFYHFCNDAQRDADDVPIVPAGDLLTVK